MVTIQNYVRAQSIDEAYELNQKKGSRYSDASSASSAFIA